MSLLFGNMTVWYIISLWLNEAAHGPHMPETQSTEHRSPNIVVFDYYFFENIPFVILDLFYSTLKMPYFMPYIIKLGHHLKPYQEAFQLF